MIPTLILCLVAGLSKGLADRIMFHIDTFKNVVGSNFWKGDAFLDPAVSWRNKYKDGEKKNGPKFWGSTTIFVWTTDLWHLLQFVFINSLVLSILMYVPGWHWMITFLLCRLIFAAGFYLTYK